MNSGEGQRWLSPIFKAIMKKTIILGLIFLGVGLAQLPTLPPVNTFTASGQTCTISVADAQMSISVDCILADGTVINRQVATPQVKGTIVGTNYIMCLYWLADATTSPQTVRLQCMTDDDSVSKIVADGKLAPVNKKRQWWIFWR